MGFLPRKILHSLAARAAFIPEVCERLGNPDWQAAAEKILIVRLSGLRDVQKSSSHLLLFAETRRALPSAFIDFAFFPERQDRETLLAEGLPWFSGLVSGRSPADFDLVLVSNAFGLELLNLPYLFSTSGMAPKASERAAKRAHARSKAGDARTGEAAGAAEDPIVVLGGSNAASAGALLFGSGGPESDSFVDAMFFGEGEGAIGELAVILTRPARTAEERLAEASAIKGLWRARSGAAASRRVVRPQPPPLLEYPILNSEEAGTARLQITAGCPGYCAFCLEGWDRRPYREVPLADILAAARELRAHSGAETLELYSFNFNTHTDIYRLLFELNRIFRRVNLMSQRLDILARQRTLLRLELAADKRSFTLGIEGISARMRRYYRKGLEDRDLAFIFERLIAPGLRELKLFYILSGFENEEDLAEFASFAKDLKARRESQAPGLRVLVSAGYLVRLPFTPLQFASLALDPPRLERIAASVKSACEAAGVEFRLAVDIDDYRADQLLALGGPKIARWLAEAPARGFVFDGGISRRAAESLIAHAEREGMLRSTFSDEKDGLWRPPLAFIEEDSHHAMLYEQYREAVACRDRALCLGGPCSDCGACEEAEDRRFLLEHRIEEPPARDFPDRIGRLIAAKTAFPRVLVELELPAALRGATPQYRSSWVLRRLSAATRGAERAVFEAEELLFSKGRLAELLPTFHGRCVFALAGPDAQATSAAAIAAGFTPIEALPEPSRIDVEVELEPPFGAGAYAALRDWLAAERIEVVERKSGGRRLLAPASRDLKKRLVYEVAIDPLRGGADEGEAFSCALALGPKARLGDWLDRLGPSATRAASIRVLGYRDSGSDPGGEQG